MTAGREMPAILIADDDADIREMLALVLGMHDLRVLGAGNGEEALGLAKSTPGVALVLLDLMMPGMSGAEVLDAMRKDPELAQLPVLVLSGDCRAKETAASLGAVGCLMKPIELDDLLREIRRFIPSA